MDLGDGFCMTVNLVAGAAGLLNPQRRLGCMGVIAIGGLALGNWFKLAAEYEGLSRRLPDMMDTPATIAIPLLAIGIPVVLYEGGRMLARRRR